jgi:hypothetical protein
MQVEVQEQERDRCNTNGKQVSKQARQGDTESEGLLHRPTRRLYQSGPRHGFTCVKVRWRGVLEC